LYIRTAILEDVTNGLADLLTEFGEFDTKDPHLVDVMFGSTSGIMFVGLDVGKVIGCATLVIDQKLIHNFGRVARIEEVVIHPDYRGKGLGKELIGYLTNEARLRRCYKVILNCNDHNVKFYENCDFYKVANTMRIDLV
jgi:glucosamine-phosphate N-acetyltransferase